MWIEYLQSKTYETILQRIITRLGGTSRPAPDGANPPANTTNANQPPPTPDASQQPSPNANIRRLLIDLITADDMLVTPTDDMFVVEGARSGASLIRDFVRIMVRNVESKK